MQYSVLGPTGVKVSRICLGTATFGGPEPRPPTAANPPSRSSAEPCDAAGTRW